MACGRARVGASMACGHGVCGHARGCKAHEHGVWACTAQGMGMACECVRVRGLQTLWHGVWARRRDARSEREGGCGRESTAARSPVMSASCPLIVISTGTETYEPLLMLCTGGDLHTACEPLRSVAGTCHGSAPTPVPGRSARACRANTHEDGRRTDRTQPRTAASDAADGGTRRGRHVRTASARGVCERARGARARREATRRRWRCQSYRARPSARRSRGWKSACR